MSDDDLTPEERYDAEIGNIADWSAAACIAALRDMIAQQDAITALLVKAMEHNPPPAPDTVTVPRSLMDALQNARHKSFPEANGDWVVRAKQWEALMSEHNAWKAGQG